MPSTVATSRRSIIRSFSADDAIPPPLTCYGIGGTLVDSLVINSAGKLERRGTVPLASKVVVLEAARGTGAARSARRFVIPASADTTMTALADQSGYDVAIPLTSLLTSGPSLQLNFRIKLKGRLGSSTSPLEPTVTEMRLRLGGGAPSATVASDVFDLSTADWAVVPSATAPNLFGQLGIRVDVPSSVDRGWLVGSFVALPQIDSKNTVFGLSFARWVYFVINAQSKYVADVCQRNTGPYEATITFGPPEHPPVCGPEYPASLRHLRIYTDAGYVDATDKSVITFPRQDKQSGVRPEVVALQTLDLSAGINSAEVVLGLFGFSGMHFPDYWDAGVVNPYLRALNTVQAAERFGIVPAFPAAIGEMAKWKATRWGALFHLPRRETGDLPHVRRLQPLFKFPNRVKGKLEGLRTHTDLPITFDALEIRPTIDPPLTQADLTPPLGGSDPTRRANIAAARRIGEFAGRMLATDATISFAAIVGQSPANAPVNGPLRTGAFDLRVVTPTATQEDSTRLVVHASLPTNEIVTERTPLPADVTLSARLLVDSLRPGGQDDVIGETRVASSRALATDPTAQIDREIESAFHREAPLVIPIDSASPAATANRYVWTIDEATRRDASRSVAMTLAALPADPASKMDIFPRTRVLVVDRNPFLIAVVNYPRPLQSQVGGGVFATWTNSMDGVGEWQIESGDDQKYSVVLPPQATGEAMERGHDITKNALVDYRFGRSARLDVIASPLARRYVAAPWNLRRLLGTPNDALPGLRIFRLQYELLYGLSCTVDRPLLRVTDTFARFGAIPGRVPLVPVKNRGRQPVLAQWAQFRLEWARTFARLNGRLSVLEPWDEATGDRRLLVDTAAMCVLRSADVATPQAGSSGLKGGALWGVESSNVYQAIVATPRSTAARLNAPGFTALGGYGFSKASFNNDLSTLYGHVAMGRTYDYTVERIGRIGVFWNVAKHVVVYERTVLPSRQFKDVQEQHSGRPILRKVREYIEILEPTRRFPENGVAPANRGFVTGCQFPAPHRINIDSRWGGDVGSEGWQVPLWNPIANRLNPETYPKPNIVLTMQTERDGKPVDVPVLIAEPQNLTFFTRTAPGTDHDTNQWPPTLGIDFALGPRPDVSEDQSRDSELRSSVPDDPEIHPGFARVTFRVVPPSEHINLAADRIASGGIRAIVDSVTMMRAPLDGLGDPPRELVALATIDGDMASVWSTLSATLRAESTAGLVGNPQQVRRLIPVDVLTQSTNAWAGEMRRANGQIHRLEDRLTGLRNAQAAELRAVAGRITNGVDAALSKFFEGAPEQWLADLWNKVALDASSALVDALRQTPGAQSHVNELKAFFEGEVLTAIHVVGASPEALTQLLFDSLRAIDEAQTGIDAAVARFQSCTGDALVCVDTLAAEVQHALRPWEQLLRARQLPWMSEATRLLDRAAVLLREKIDAARYNIAQAKALATGVGGALAIAKTDIANARALVRPTNVRFTDAGASVTITTPTGAVVLRLRLDEAIRQRWTTATASLAGQLPNDANQIRNLVNAAVQNFVDGVKADRDSIRRQIADDAARVVSVLWSQVGAALVDWNEVPAVRQLEKGIALAKAAVDNLATELPKAARDLDALRDAATSMGAVGRDAVGNATGAIAPVAEQAIAALGKLPVDPTLRLIRAFGNPPALPDLKFDRDKVAYYYRDPAGAIGITPVVAYLNDVASSGKSALKAVGLRLPTRRLLDRCIPDALEQFDLNQVFRDFAALRLPGLFSGLRLPSIANDKIVVKHGFDPQQQRAWVEASVNALRIPPATLFSLGPLTVEMPSATFEAVAGLSTTRDGATKRTTSARILADWLLRVGGVPIVTLEETALTFGEDGSLRFKVDPKKISTPGALAFVSLLLKKLIGPDSGITVSMLPNGVESVIDLPLPNLQGGAFSITNLRLGANMKLLLEDGGVTIETRAFLGLREAPFAVTIFVLGGSGYLDANARYTPGKPGSYFSVEVGVAACASIGIALGPIEGSVAIYAGIQCTVAFGNGRSGGVAFGAYLLITGKVAVLGIVEASLSLMLELIYSSGNLIGRGTLKLTIKICWCFTLKVNTSFEYRLACDALHAPHEHALGSPSSLVIAPADIQSAANDYIDLLLV